MRPNLLGGVALHKTSKASRSDSRAVQSIVDELAPVRVACHRRQAVQRTPLTLPGANCEARRRATRNRRAIVALRFRLARAGRLGSPVLRNAVPLLPKQRPPVGLIRELRDLQFFLRSTIRYRPDFVALARRSGLGAVMIWATPRAGRWYFDQPRLVVV